MRVGVTLAILMAMTSTALAGGGFDIVVPSRAGVPIIINGIDASYAVIEGEWGLGKNEQVQPTIYGGRYIDPDPHVGHYIARFGVRKCEANALVVVPEIGRQLCRDAILEFIPAAAPARYRRKLDRERAKLRQAIRRLAP